MSVRESKRRRREASAEEEGGGDVVRTRGNASDREGNGEGEGEGDGQQQVVGIVPLSHPLGIHPVGTLLLEDGDGKGGAYANAVRRRTQGERGASSGDEHGVGMCIPLLLID